MHRTLALVVMLLLSAAAVAQDPPKVDQILAQQTQLRTDLAAGKLAITPRVAMQVRKDQDIVFDIIKRKPTLESMNIQERVTLDNALERINASVQGTRVADEQKEICRYRRVTGSKQLQLACGTQDDRDHDRDSARAYLEKPRICEPPCTGR